MGKMSELSAEGVTDLHSYGVGKADGLTEGHAMGRLEAQAEVVGTIIQILKESKADLSTTDAQTALIALASTFLKKLKAEKK